MLEYSQDKEKIELKHIMIMMELLQQHLHLLKRKSAKVITLSSLAFAIVSCLSPNKHESNRIMEFKDNEGRIYQVFKTEDKNICEYLVFDSIKRPLVIAKIEVLADSVLEKLKAEKNNANKVLNFVRMEPFLGKRKLYNYSDSTITETNWIKSNGNYCKGDTSRIYNLNTLLIATKIDKRVDSGKSSTTYNYYLNGRIKSVHNQFWESDTSKSRNELTYMFSEMFFNQKGFVTSIKSNLKNCESINIDFEEGLNYEYLNW